MKITKCQGYGEGSILWKDRAQLETKRQSEQPVFVVHFANAGRLMSRRGNVRTCPRRNRQSTSPIRLKELRKSAIFRVHADGTLCCKKAPVTTPRAVWGPSDLAAGSVRLCLLRRNSQKHTPCIINWGIPLVDRWTLLCCCCCCWCCLVVLLLLLLLKSQRYKNVDSSEILRTFRLWYRF